MISYLQYCDIKKKNHFSYLLDQSCMALLSKVLFIFKITTNVHTSFDSFVFCMNIWSSESCGPTWLVHVLYQGLKKALSGKFA